MNPAAQRHIPVLGRQAVEMLAPRDRGIYVDATFGAGGYSRAILDTAGTRVIGIDRDRTAILGGFDLVDRSDGRLTDGSIAPREVRPHSGPGVLSFPARFDPCER